MSKTYAKDVDVDMYFARLKPGASSERTKLLVARLQRLNTRIDISDNDLKLEVDQADYLSKVDLFAEVFAEFHDIIEQKPRFPEVSDDYWK